MGVGVCVCVCSRAHRPPVGAFIYFAVENETMDGIIEARYDGAPHAHAESVLRAVKDSAKVRSAARLFWLSQNEP